MVFFNFVSFGFWTVFGVQLGDNYLLMTCYVGLLCTIIPLTIKIFLHPKLFGDPKLFPIPVVAASVKCGGDDDDDAMLKCEEDTDKDTDKNTKDGGGVSYHDNKDVNMDDFFLCGDSSKTVHQGATNVEFSPPSPTLHWEKHLSTSPSSFSDCVTHSRALLSPSHYQSPKSCHHRNIITDPYSSSSTSSSSLQYGDIEDGLQAPSPASSLMRNVSEIVSEVVHEVAHSVDDYTAYFFMNEKQPTTTPSSTQVEMTCSSPHNSTMGTTDSNHKQSLQHDHHQHYRNNDDRGGSIVTGESQIGDISKDAAAPSYSASSSNGGGDSSLHHKYHHITTELVNRLNPFKFGVEEYMPQHTTVCVNDEEEGIVVSHSTSSNHQHKKDDQKKGDDDVCHDVVHDEASMSSGMMFNYHPVSETIVATDSSALLPNESSSELIQGAHTIPSTIESSSSSLFEHILHQDRDIRHTAGGSGGGGAYLHDDGSSATISYVSISSNSTPPPPPPPTPFVPLSAEDMIHELCGDDIPLVDELDDDDGCGEIELTDDNDHEEKSAITTLLSPSPSSSSLPFPRRSVLENSYMSCLGLVRDNKRGDRGGIGGEEV
jgi:hypothetical protein